MGGWVNEWFVGWVSKNGWFSGWVNGSLVAWVLMNGLVGG